MAVADPLDPRGLLPGVHPDLARVLRAAFQKPQAFLIVQGLRSVSNEATAVASGHSTTMHSRHLPDPRYANVDFPRGLACAVDVAALEDGKISFAAGREAQVFGHIAVEVKVAADELHIPLEWGGDWHSFKDWGHFQLPWKNYP